MLRMPCYLGYLQHVKQTFLFLSGVPEAFAGATELDPKP